MLGLDIFENSAEVTALLKSEIRAFQREKRVGFAKAISLFRTGVRQKLRSGNPLKAGSKRGAELRSYGASHGPAYLSIYGRIRRTSLDLYGFVAFRARAFYLAFHETGVSKTVRRGKSGREYHFTLKKRPVFEPVAQENRETAIQLVGDAYSVFQGGSAVVGF